MSEEPTIIFSGTCEKRGTASSFFGSKAYKSRYIVLTSDGKLSYYENEKSTKPLKEPMDLDGYQLLVAANPKEGKWELSFVKTDSKPLTLRFKSEEERKQWITAIAGNGVEPTPVNEIASPEPENKPTESFSASEPAPPAFNLPPPPKFVLPGPPQ